LENMSRVFSFSRRTLLKRLASGAVAFPAIGSAISMLTGEKVLSAITPPSPESSVSVLSRSMVFAHPSADPYDPNDRYGMNHAPSVIALPDGRVMAAWFSGPFEGAVNQLILASFSSDQGTTWSPAEPLQDFPRISDFDPAFIVDGQRTWFFFSAGRWNRYPTVRDEARAIGAASFATYARYSDDSGRTWSPPVVIAPHHGSRTNGIKLSTGELLLPVSSFIRGGGGGVLKSADGGQSWTPKGNLIGGGEPTIAELNSGAILMFLRTKGGFLWKSISRDKGETWAPAEKTTMIGTDTSANLFRLKDGRLVLTHDESPNQRTPLTIRSSKDDGQTWSEPFTITSIAIPPPDDPVWSVQVTYPSVTQLPDDSLVVVWSQIVVADQEQYGNIRAARLRL
jgi:Neuraminidase (sialidase)